MRLTTMLAAFTLVLNLCVLYATAQTTLPADTLKVDYFANANTAGAPDGTVRMTNYMFGPVCANIYVFASDQEMSECCSCYLSPDGLRTLSVNTDLTGNPLTSVTLNTGTIKIVSSPPTSGTCPLPDYPIAPTPCVRAWSTHIQSGGFAITETPSQDTTLSSAELARLENECAAVAQVGSGKGVCTCGTGD